MWRPPASYPPNSGSLMPSPWPLSVGRLPTCSSTPGHQALPVPKTTDQLRSRHFCSLCGFLRIEDRTGTGGRRRGPATTKNRDSTDPKTGCLIPLGRSERVYFSAWMGFKLSHRGQFQVISFPDGIYLNLYITCNFFSNSFLSLFYFFLNSIFGIGQLILKK